MKIKINTPTKGHCLFHELPLGETGEIMTGINKGRIVFHASVGFVVIGDGIRSYAPDYEVYDVTVRVLQEGESFTVVI